MALSYFQIRKSLFGRLLGISSTGGLVMGVGSTGKLSSSDVDMAAQMWGPGMRNDSSSLTPTVNNHGVTVLNATAASSATFLAPVKGVSKEVIFNSTFACVMTTTSTLIKFFVTGTTGAGGSTALTFTPSIGTYAAMRLRGGSTTDWWVMSHSSNVSS